MAEGRTNASPGRRSPRVRSAWHGALAALAASALCPFAAPGAAPQPPADANPGADLVGRPAPAWSVSDWIHSRPLDLGSLRGKVVLARWWTGPACPYCSSSAPVLEGLHRRHRDHGLVVIGFYHHKSGGPVRPGQVRRWARAKGMTFPIAVDHGWRTLRRYWLDRAPEGSWTSVSFLIDQDGIIQAMHPGGTITEEDGARLEERISRLLERPTTLPLEAPR